MITNFQSPNLQREIIRRKTNNLFSDFHQLIYSSTSFMITNFQSPNLQKEIIRKQQHFFLRFSPIDLLIILYQLTKFKASSCYSFRDIMITNFQSPNLQREIIRKKQQHFFYQLVYSSSSISRQSFKLQAVIVFEIS